MRRFTLRAAASIACVVATSSFADETQNSTDTPPPATQAASPLQDAVRIPAVPNVSLLVPRGWYSCDDATNALLGGVKMPGAFTAAFCKPDDPKDAKFKIVNPNMAEIVMGLIMEKPANPDMIERFATMSPDELRLASDKFCSFVSGKQGASVVNCNVAPTTIGDHHAVSGSVDGIGQGSGSAFNAKFLAFATPEHVYLVILADTEASRARTGPLIDAMLASVEIQ